jgi:dihydropteroate synthase
MDADPADRPRLWKYRGGQFTLGTRTLLMGVVNITPDSFSDGGKFYARDAAVAHAVQLQDEGADMFDLGAESTRPGSTPVPHDEQLRRLLPVLKELAGTISAPISIDTTSAVVARECLTAGAAIVNDITGFHRDPDLPSVCAEFAAGVVLMHIKGTPETMQSEPQYRDLFGEIHDYLHEGVRVAARAGIPRERILVDPGIGFGKTFEHNYRLLGALYRFQDLAAGVLVGPSRKAFKGEFNKLPANRRQFSTAATVAIAALNGADVIRVHDIREMKQVVEILDRFRAIQDAEAHGIADR